MNPNITDMLNKKEYAECYVLADKLSAKGDIDGAAEIYEAVYKCCCEDYGKDSDQAYVSLRKYAGFAHNSGRYKQATELYKSYLAYVMKKYGDELICTDYFDVASDLALIYEQFGDHENALAMRKEIFDNYNTFFGKYDVHTIFALGEIGLSYYTAGKFNDALNIFSYQLELASEGKSLDHYHFIRIFQNIGRVYLDTKVYDKAEEYLSLAYDACINTYGEKDSRDLLSVLNDLSTVYSVSGKRKEALLIKEKLVEVSKRVFGEEHNNTRMSMANLASAYAESGDLKKGRELALESAEWFEKNIGTSSDQTLAALGILAYVYSQTREYDKHLELRTKLYEMSCELYGKDHPSTLDRQIALSNAYNDIGQHSQALSIISSVMETAKSSEDPDYSVIMYALAMRMVYDYQIESYNGVIDLYNEFASVYNSFVNNNPYDLELIFGIMSLSLARVGQSEEAIEMSEQCMEVSKKLYGDDGSDPYYLEDLSDNAYVYSMAGYPEKAIDKMRFSIDKQIEHGVDNTPLYKKQVRLAKIYIAHGFYQQAVDEINEISESTDKDQLAEVSYTKALLMYALGENEKALNELKTAIEMTKEKDPWSHDRKKLLRLYKRLKADCED
ncbi:MAG: tetratricopeptide repeat protein [Ruminococcus sp.]|nr:tetratricopeptide repeat protein [Ruminococcus sp.]